MAEIAAGSAAWIVGGSLLGLVGGGVLIAQALGGQKQATGCGGGCPPGQICNPATNQCVTPGSCGGCPLCPSGYVCDLTTCQCVPALQTCPGGCPQGYWCDTSGCGSTLTNGCGTCRQQIPVCSPLCSPGQYCDELDCPNPPIGGCGHCVAQGLCRTTGQCGPNQFCSQCGCGSSPTAGCGHCITVGTCLCDGDCLGGQVCQGASGGVPGTCVTPAPSTWSISIMGMSLSTGHVSSTGGETIDADMAVSYTGPGGSCLFGAYVVSRLGGCSFTLPSPMNAYLPPNGNPSAAPLHLGWTSTWPGCFDCLLGTYFDLIPYLVDPTGTEWRGATCYGCLSC